MEKGPNQANGLQHREARVRTVVPSSQMIRCCEYGTLPETIMEVENGLWKNNCSSTERGLPTSIFVGGNVCPCIYVLLCPCPSMNEYAFHMYSVFARCVCVREQAHVYACCMYVSMEVTSP